MRLPHLSCATRITIMSSRKFYRLYDHSSAFRLFNIIISLFLRLVSLLPVKEILRIQNLFKI